MLHLCYAIILPILGISPPPLYSPSWPYEKLASPHFYSSNRLLPTALVGSASSDAKLGDFGWHKVCNIRDALKVFFLRLRTEKVLGCLFSRKVSNCFVTRTCTNHRPLRTCTATVGPPTAPSPQADHQPVVPAAAATVPRPGIVIHTFHFAKQRQPLLCRESVKGISPTTSQISSVFFVELSQIMGGF